MDDFDLTRLIFEHMQQTRSGEISAADYRLWADEYASEHSIGDEQFGRCEEAAAQTPITE